MGQCEDTGAGPIWLVGMMGAGKSTVGEQLARRLGRPFRDADAEIVARSGRSISEIFEHAGEAAFRAQERAVVDTLAESEAVVALGGGAFSQPEVRARVAQRGISVYLSAGLDTLLARLGAAEDRPLLAGISAGSRREKLDALLEARRRDYETANVTIATDGQGTSDVVQRVVEAVQEAVARAQLAAGDTEIPEESKPRGSDPTATGR